MVSLIQKLTSKAKASSELTAFSVSFSQARLRSILFPNAACSTDDLFQSLTQQSIVVTGLCHDVL